MQDHSITHKQMKNTAAAFQSAGCTFRSEVIHTHINLARDDQGLGMYFWIILGAIFIW